MTAARSSARAAGPARARAPHGRGIPSLRVERALHRQGYTVVAGMDEVGRGALAGPVSVGLVVVTESSRPAPQGVRDSKLLAPPAREALVPRIQRWAVGYAVGHASAAEIDAVGIMAALRLAGVRALEALPVRPDVIVLDGNHDWLTAPEDIGLFAFADETVVSRTPPVETMIKADLRCSSVAAASVLAKVERDAIMVGLSGDHPAYRWEVNKGYAAPEHLDALQRHGPCDVHRRSWRLRVPTVQVVEPGVGAPRVTEAEAAALVPPGMTEAPLTIRTRDTDGPPMGTDR